MANSGRFCLVVSNRPYAQLAEKLERWLTTHLIIKKAQLELPKLLPIPGHYVIWGSAERLTAKDLLAFFGGAIPAGVRAFVVDATYGAEWEELAGGTVKQ